MVFDQSININQYILPVEEEPSIEAFQEIIWHHYATHRRSFPWREEISPYGVVVSEIMLQQTQTHRVAAKYQAFVDAFPNFLALAEAPFSEVLRLWKGLGYNRRAMNLQKIATAIVKDYEASLPRDIISLEGFAGIGKATARSIFSFAFDAPSVFIETNIRTVFLFFFFKNRTTKVHDREIEVLVEKSLTSRPRDWYYALMDFGAMLKKAGLNLNHQSAHYKTQSKFIGSDRQLRGRILQFLLDNSPASGELENNFVDEEPRFSRILAQLCSEGLVKKVDGLYFL
jgi:A/G-specific adenine glycosylase